MENKEHSWKAVGKGCPKLGGLLILGLKNDIITRYPVSLLFQVCYFS